MLNWRPVFDYEIRKIAYEQRQIVYEQRKAEHEQRMKRLKNENAQLAAIESRLERFEREHLSNSSPPSCIDDSSPS